MATLSDDAARYDARFNEQIAQEARHWLAYLRARQTLLELETSAGQVAFELAESHETEADAARARIAALAPASRARFETVVERERLEVQAELERTGAVSAAEPDAALRQALATLLADAAGDGTEGGQALVPFGPPDEVRWYALDREVLEGVPDASQYAAGAPAERQRMRRSLMVAVPLLVLGLVWIFLPRAARLGRGPETALVNGTPVAVWPVARADVATPDGTRTIDISIVENNAWQSLPKGQAGWYAPSVVPLRLCLPSALLEQASALTLLAHDTHPARRYALSDMPATETPDLVVEGCDRVSVRRSGILHDVLPQPEQPIGQLITLADETRVSMEAISLTGRGEDPTLPDGQARVQVRVRAEQALDWPALAPTLRLPSGAALLPSETVAVSDALELRYLVPAPRVPLAVAWSLASPSGDTLRWRATLATPPTRDAVLRAALQLAGVQAEREAGVVRVTLQLRNAGTRPLALLPDEITLTRQERAVAFADEQVLQVPLAPGETRSFALSSPEALPLVVQAGPHRIAVEEGR
jgi:hypothetical protein